MTLLELPGVGIDARQRASIDTRKCGEASQRSTVASSAADAGKWNKRADNPDAGRSDGCNSSGAQTLPGTAGIVAAQALMPASAHGCTLMVAPGVVPVAAPLALRGLGYEPRPDFAHLSQLVGFELTLAVAQSRPACSMS